jgi:hypothetical protein
VVSNLPITQSTTCRFGKAFSVNYRRNTDDSPSKPERMFFSVSEETSGTDTVSFADLDTAHPKVVSNGGQGTLRVVAEDGEVLALELTSGPTLDVYTIYRAKGIVVYSQHKNSLLIGPLGVLEMGYCN